MTPHPDGAGAEHPCPPTADTYPPSRLNALCDGVFAIAMTLLALEIRIPDAGGDPVRFRSLLPGFGGQLGLYALAFVIIGRFWQSQHRLGVHVHHVDQAAIRRTIALLAGVSTLPVATALLVRDGQYPDAVALAAGLMTLTGLLSLWQYRRLAQPDLSDLGPGTRAHLLRRGALSTLVLALALPLAYLLPDSSYAPLVWWALLLVEPAARGLARWSEAPAARSSPLPPWVTFLPRGPSDDPARHWRRRPHPRPAPLTVLAEPEPRPGKEHFDVR